MSESPPPPSQGEPPSAAFTPPPGSAPDPGLPSGVLPPPPMTGTAPPPAADFPGPSPYSGSGVTPTYSSAAGIGPGQSSNKAILSVVFGAIDIFCPIFVLGIVGLVLAISARSDIRRSGGALGGSGAATAGLVVSIIGLALNTLFWLFWIAVLGAIVTGTHNAVRSGY